MSRERARSLWLHCAVAGHLVQAPEVVLKRGRTNIDRFLAASPAGPVRHWLGEWLALIDDGPAAVAAALTDASERGVELRQNTPFAGVLTPDERRRVLAAFYRGTVAR